MENTFIDNKIIKKDLGLDFITVRSTDYRVVFLGQRKNVKCFDRLKKVSERVFETLQGQTYRFLDKMPEPQPEPEARPATSLPIVKQPVSFEEQIIKDWKTRPDIRAEFISITSYAAYKRAEKAGRIGVCGR